MAGGRQPRATDGGTTMTVVAAAADGYRTHAASSIDRAIRLSTAAAVLAVAGIAAYVSYWHAYAVVWAHGESGITARLAPATIDGLVYASSMLVLYAARHRVPVPSLARGCSAWGSRLPSRRTWPRAGPTVPSGRLSQPGRRSVWWARMSFLVWLIRTSGTVEHRLAAGHRCEATACRAATRSARPQPLPPSSPAAASATYQTRNGSLRLRSPGRRPCPPAGSATSRYLRLTRSMTPRWPRTG